jgi:hypothetical protein
MEIDEKCAPSKLFKDGSCLTLKSLKLIIESYNKNIKDIEKKIVISNNKSEMVKQLEEKLSDKCNNQTCWLRLDIIKQIKDEKMKKDILENTFRPEGPPKKDTWLSTSDINDVVTQYQEKYKDFLFLGALPADFQEIGVLGINDLDFKDVEKEGKHKIGIVINLDLHTQGGSHWVALFTDLQKGQIYYFDSFAKKPSKRTKKFINKIVKYLYKKNYNKDININSLIKTIKSSNENKDLTNLKKFDIRHNTIQHQFSNSECGVYSINFIVRLVGGENFDEITQNITKDNEMNKCRTKYFRNVDIR